jgi:hypothetical protein
VERKEPYQVKISDGFTALGNLDCNVKIGRGGITVKENIKISAKDSVGYNEFK